MRTSPIYSRNPKPEHIDRNWARI